MPEVALNIALILLIMFFYSILLINMFTSLKNYMSLSYQNDLFIVNTVGLCYTFSHNFLYGDFYCYIPTTKYFVIVGNGNLSVYTSTIGYTYNVSNVKPVNGYDTGSFYLTFNTQSISIT